MKTNVKYCYQVASCLILLSIFSLVPSFGSVQRRGLRPPARPSTVAYHTLGADTVIRVRVNAHLNSKTARVADRFSTSVTEPVSASGGTVVIPVGSKIWGRVSLIRRAGRRTPGTIAVSFYSIELPNGSRHSMNGSLTSLQADDINSDNESTVSGRANRKRDAVFIGGGAAGGAIIGAIAGGGKGAAVGAILGGAAGTGARVYEKESEADIASGTEFGVILNRAISMPGPA